MTGLWQDIKLDSEHKLPLYKQISEQVEKMVYQGKLKPGTRLPSERKLADYLQVSRMTITLANEDMKTKGIIRSQQGSGTFIMRGPRRERVSTKTKWQSNFVYETDTMNHGLEAIIKFGQNSESIQLARAGTAPEIHPGIEISECLAECLREHPKLIQLPSPTQGYGPLHSYMLEWLKESGLYPKKSEMMIVSGAMQGLDLISRLFLGPGDYVIVEEPGFQVASDAFTASGAEILRITLDKEGIKLDNLEQLLRNFPVKFIYLNPTFHNPTGIVMSQQRRKDLLTLAKKYHVLLIEDDPTSLLYYGKKPAPPLKTMDEDGMIIYLRSFSKYLFPELRVAVVVAPEGIIANLTKIKQRIDLHSNVLTQAAVYTFLSEGRLAAHLQRVRKAYKIRVDMVQEAFSKSKAVSVQIPEGGIFAWCKLEHGLSSERLLDLALPDVSLVPGNWMSGTGMYENYFRLAFTNPPLEQLKRGLNKIVEIIDREDMKT
ncbi:PLP-dependent aminotransferase family protein [Peribacillus asahii]|uniref:MocR-like pyridoxine biosynthesis transcription factor PdxR n=1 Tax=Peribacillus asahii TaxID=228899 RepID=UPI00207A5B88|nr:PLP-dependent aminotransferase family protein [Peribacillus asahii]USK70221.1 PLP-dependent aminotransferase family protein [Peribacillus asahii]